MSSGQSARSSAIAEAIDPSTLFRALRRRRETGESVSRVVIIGAGNLGREVMQWVRIDGPGEEIVFLDDHATGENVIGNLASYERQPGDQVLIAVADPATRERIAVQLLSIASFVAKSATVGKCSIGEGSILLPHSLVSADAVVGRCCIVNAHSLVGHDVMLSDFCTVSSHVDVCGHVVVGPRVLFGSGARVLPRLSIGADAVIGAGAVVVQDVPAGAVMFGNPARRIK